MTPPVMRALLAPLRLALARAAHDPAARFLRFHEGHGCLRAAASHIAWNSIPGDYLEFGTFRGSSFAEAYHAITYFRDMVHRGNPKLHGQAAYEAWRAAPPRLFAFDSFEGLPASMAAGHSDYFEGSYACSEPEFLANVTGAGVPAARITTVPGFFDRSLTAALKQRHALRRAAIVMIDCDLYESTVPVLEFVTDLVQQGTIMVFHDWYRYSGDRRQGEQRATHEWLGRNPHLELEPWWQEGPQAKAFLVHAAEPPTVPA